MVSTYQKELKWIFHFVFIKNIQSNFIRIKTLNIIF